MLAFGARGMVSGPFFDLASKINGPDGMSSIFRETFKRASRVVRDRRATHTLFRLFMHLILLAANTIEALDWRLVRVVCVT